MVENIVCSKSLSGPVFPGIKMSSIGYMSYALTFALPPVVHPAFKIHLPVGLSNLSIFINDDVSPRFIKVPGYAEGPEARIK